MYKTIMFLYPNARLDTDFVLAQNRDGAVEIVFWNTSTLGLQPPQAQIDAAMPAADMFIMKAALEKAVQNHLDATVKARGYDGILSACTYANSANATFGAEGLAAVVWRDAVWAYCYTVLAAIQAGTRGIPTEAELIAELPAMAW